LYYAARLSLFDQHDMASITAPDHPGERLVVRFSKSSLSVSKAY
jgi:hypothetical protein